MQSPSYEQVASMLSAYGDAITVSECHGILCGLLSCHTGMSRESWAEQMLTGELAEQGMIGESISTGSDVDELDRATLEALYEDAVKQLHDPEMGFQLLLPDDDEELSDRTAALADWCQGYLYGLGLGGIKDFNGFSETVRDYCNDLVEISRITHEEGDEAANETAFFEIVEYVRMGVIMLHDELADVSGSDDDDHGSDSNEHKIVLH